MKKVFLIHGFEGLPNGGWRPWLLGELAREKKIYGCALPMPTPYEPKVSEWVAEINRVSFPKEDSVVLVGHSLGATAVLRYLETLPPQISIAGAVLVSGPLENLPGVENSKNMQSFFEQPFEFEKIKASCKKFAVIHGANDNVVPFSHAEKLAKHLNCELISIPEGFHLSGGAGWYKLPEAFTEILKILGE